MVGGAGARARRDRARGRADRRLARKLLHAASRSRATWCSPRRTACCPAPTTRSSSSIQRGSRSCATSPASPRIRSSISKPCSRIARPRTWRCSSSPLRSRRVAPARSAPPASRSRRAIAFMVAGTGVATRGDGKSGGTVRAANLVATGRPGTLQIRLSRSRHQGRESRAWRLHRRFRRAGVPHRERRARDHRRGELVDRARETRPVAAA